MSAHVVQELDTNVIGISHDPARRLLELLDPQAVFFTFQAIRDREPKTADKPVQLPPGQLDRLAKRNANGFGIFFCVNETDGRGRKKANIVRVRAVWLDLDGAPLEPILQCELTPHAVVETSPGRYHVYWLVEGITPEQAEVLMPRMVRRFGGDRAATDCSRVLRLPGFWHQKGEPFLVRIIHAEEGMPYTAEQVEAHLCATVEAPGQGANGRDPDFRSDTGDLDVRGLEAALNGSGKGWHTAMNKLVGRMVAHGYTDGMINAVILAYRWPEYTVEQTEREIQTSIHGARNKGYAKPQSADSAPLDIIGVPELMGWPELSEDCLPAPLLRYVEAEADRLSVDPCALAAHVLGACAASISDEWTIKPKYHDHWTQNARLWTCVVKDVGARGTELLRSAFWPLKERDRELRKVWQREHAEWKERLAADKKCTDPEPRCVRLVTQDATVEAAGSILSHGNEYSKLSIVADELVGFLGSFGRYNPKGAAARGLWLEGFDGGPQAIDRINRGHIFIPNWSICVSGNIQPRRLTAAAKDLVDDGLFQRFLTVHMKPAAIGCSDDRPKDVSAGQNYRDLLTALAALRPPQNDGKPAVVYVEREGHEERDRFMALIERLRIDTTLPDIIRETSAKWSGLLARLTLIFHLVDLAEMAKSGATPEPRDLCQASVPNVTKAASFIRRVVMPNLFRLGFESLPDNGAPAAHARWIAGHILSSGAESLTSRDIGRAYRQLRGKPLEVDQAMAILADTSWVFREEVGRVDSARWAVNPAVHSKFASAAVDERERRLAIRKVVQRNVLKL